MDAGFEAHLDVDGEAFDRRDAALLRAVDEHGSLNAAAEALGRSYSRAHSRVSDLESVAGPLVDRERGGSGGGGSRLTEDARDLLARFDRLQAALAGTATTERVVLRGTVRERDGDLATVETDAGTVRAVVVAGVDDEAGSRGDRVQVAFRSDAVTLHAPDEAPGETATSARNRFDGTVTDVESGDGTALASVDVGVTDPLVVRITETSRRRLPVEAGAAVVASFKATATRATPLRGHPPSDDGRTNDR
jgi:molybdate transport system regulatory protein